MRSTKGQAATAMMGVLLVATGCAGTSTKHVTPTPTTDQPVKGGTLVIALAGEPSCADWLAACGTFQSGFTAMGRPTVPRALDYVDGQYRPTAVLAGEPVVAAGPPQRVTYRLNPKAVWSDGQPITSSDFRYSWDQVVNGAGIANRTGFDKIESVDDTDPKTAVVTFKEAYAAWRTLFATILPKHLLDGKDRGAEMKDGYSWSGGPWVIDHWTRGQEIKLVPNPRYWDKLPNLEAVVWKIIPDTAAALAAYKTGQVSLLQNLPPEATAADLHALPDTRPDVATSLGVSWISFNTQKPPLDSTAVRQALAYSADRDAVVSQVLGPIKPDVKAVQSWTTPASGRWYLEPYARYRPDPAKVAQLMGGDGWVKGTDGIWAKGGQRAQFELLGSTAKSNQLARQILQSQWKAAGFDVSLADVSPSAQADREAKGAYDAETSGFAFPSDDPGRCSFLCSRSIPSAANANSGQNVTRVADPALDAAWARVDAEVDDAKRLDAVKQADNLTADLVPGLPFAPGLATLVYSTARLAGPISNNIPYPFFNLNEWYCRGGTC